MDYSNTTLIRSPIRHPNVQANIKHAAKCVDISGIIAHFRASVQVFYYIKWCVSFDMTSTVDGHRICHPGTLGNPWKIKESLGSITSQGYDTHNSLRCIVFICDGALVQSVEFAWLLNFKSCYAVCLLVPVVLGCFSKQACVTVCQPKFI